MKQLIECVPNFSEGRDMEVIRQITDEIESVEGVKLLDVDPGKATNRTVVTFVGVVRGETDGHQVQHLEYEAYPGMAENTLRQIGDEVKARWPDVREVVIVHRVGQLGIGERAVVIAISAGHRPSLFDALHYTIDRLKEIVPIWKKEVRDDGSEWRSEGA